MGARRGTIRVGRSRRRKSERRRASVLAPSGSKGGRNGRTCRAELFGRSRARQNKVGSGPATGRQAMADRIIPNPGRRPFSPSFSKGEQVVLLPEPKGFRSTDSWLPACRPGRPEAARGPGAGERRLTANIVGRRLASAGQAVLQRPERPRPGLGHTSTA